MIKFSLVIRGNHNIGDNEIIYYHHQKFGDETTEFGIRLRKEEFSYFNDLFVKDPENWIDDINNYSVIKIPVNCIEDPEKGCEFLKNLGIISDPPFILNNPDITINHDIWPYKDYTTLSGWSKCWVDIDVDLTRCIKMGNYLVNGTKIRIPQEFNVFLGQIEDPERKIEQYLDKHQITLKTKSTSDGTIDGFPLIIKEYHMTIKDINLSSNSTIHHLSKIESNTEHINHKYALVIPKKENDHLKDSFINDIKGWPVDRNILKTHVLLEIPFKYIETMSIPIFIKICQIRS